MFPRHVAQCRQILTQVEAKVVCCVGPVHDHSARPPLKDSCLSLRLQDDATRQFIVVLHNCTRIPIDLHVLVEDDTHPLLSVRPASAQLRCFESAEPTHCTLHQNVHASETQQNIFARAIRTNVVRNPMGYLLGWSASCQQNVHVAHQIQFGNVATNLILIEERLRHLVIVEGVLHSTANVIQFFPGVLLDVVHSLHASHTRATSAANATHSSGPTKWLAQDNRYNERAGECARLRSCFF